MFIRNFLNQKKIKNKSGQVLIQIIIFSSLVIILLAGFVQWSMLSIKAARQLTNREQAFAIAEAGIEYYRWHLAHAAQDFQDGTGGPGPYAHDYFDKDGNKIGQFILTITPPPVGSTLVTIVAEGKIDADPNLSRKIKTQMGIPSWAKYSYVSNSFVWFGSSEETFGEVHSNAGIRLDSIAHNIITSAQATFKDPDHSGANEFGVHTHKDPADPLPPADVPSRPDVFLAGRIFPVPAIDFAGLSADLAQLKTKAQTDGLYFADSGVLGYNVILKTDDTFDLYKVTSMVAAPAGCNNALNQSDWKTWSILSQVFLSNNNLPQNGTLFFEDHVWVEGQIDTARIIIVSGHFPEAAGTNTNIIVNNNLTYSNFDGRDTIGLLAQNHFLVGLKSANDLEVDAAIIAKNGSTQRYYYKLNCGPEYLRNSLKFVGMSAPFLRGNAFAYCGGTCVTVSSGYNTVTFIYDSNLLYTPPPSFPLTSDQYSTLTWEEVQ